MLEERLSHAVIETFFRVYNRLGYGFLESVYAAAMMHELTKGGYATQREVPIQVLYDGIVLGNYRADLLVDGRIVVEVKTETGLSAAPERQLRNYLRSSDIEIGMLLVFGLKPRFKRLIHTRDRKAASG